MSIITKETLERLRSNQQKPYYGSDAKAMFVDGKFNPNNWNGGDGVIRQYFSFHRDDNGYLKQHGKEVSFRWEHGGFDGDLITSHYISHNDQSYATIILDGWMDIPVSEGAEDFPIHLITYFSWYKSRGQTELFNHNGLKYSDELIYLIVLNAIEATGFNFDLHTK